MNDIEETARDLNRVSILDDNISYLNSKVKQYREEKKEIIKRLGKIYYDYRKQPRELRLLTKPIPSSSSENY